MAVIVTLVLFLGGCSPLYACLPPATTHCTELWSMDCISKDDDVDDDHDVACLFSFVSCMRPSLLRVERLILGEGCAATFLHYRFVLSFYLYLMAKSLGTGQLRG